MRLGTGGIDGVNAEKTPVAPRYQVNPEDLSRVTLPRLTKPCCSSTVMVSLGPPVWPD